MAKLQRIKATSKEEYFYHFYRLCNLSPHYREFPLLYLHPLADSAFRFDRYFFYADGGNILACVFYANMPAEIEETYNLDQHIFFGKESWDGGDNLWVRELVAPYGRVMEIARDLKNTFCTQYTAVKWKRCLKNRKYEVTSPWAILSQQ